MVDTSREPRCCLSTLNQESPNDLVLNLADILFRVGLVKRFWSSLILLDPLVASKHFLIFLIFAISVTPSRADSD